MLSSNHFAENLKRFRKISGLTQSDVAAQLFVSTQAVSKWEQGLSVPDIDHLCALSRILNISSDALLGITPTVGTALLAVDGGGTKTEFLLIEPSGNIIKRLLMPGTNPNVDSLENSLQIFCQGIDQMQRTGYQILGIFIGCAGMGSGNLGATMTDMLQKKYPGIQLCCKSDIYNVLACARDPENAIAVISGTGSVVYATASGKLIRAGGGGWMLDPAGSGYELGRQALAAALAHRDGTGAPTAMTDAIERKLGSSVWTSIPEIYKLSTPHIAAYAPFVLDAWQNSDTVATQIVEENCKRLAHLIRTLAERTPKATELLLHGSLLTKNETFRDHVIRLIPTHLQASLFLQPQIWGACLQCAKLCGLPMPDEALFQAQYSNEVESC